MSEATSNVPLTVVLVHGAFADIAHLPTTTRSGEGAHMTGCMRR
jgi:hypothetical protein